MCVFWGGVGNGEGKAVVDLQVCVVNCIMYKRAHLWYACLLGWCGEWRR